MSASKEYKQNRIRVFEIYGVNPADPNYNCHHIIQRSDFKKHPEQWKDHHVNEISNLIPLTTRDHDRVHEMINERDGVDQQQKKHKKRWWRR
jgi:hypothetical protein